MPEYISKDVAFQRLLCKESEFNHWNDYNLAQYIIAQIVPEDDSCEFGERRATTHV